jgi:hypothetical protein
MVSKGYVYWSWSPSYPQIYMPSYPIPAGVVPLLHWQYATLLHSLIRNLSLNNI